MRGPPVSVGVLRCSDGVSNQNEVVHRIQIPNLPCRPDSSSPSSDALDTHKAVSRSIIDTSRALPHAGPRYVQFNPLLFLMTLSTQIGVDKNIIEYATRDRQILLLEFRDISSISSTHDNLRRFHIWANRVVCTTSHLQLQCNPTRPSNESWNSTYHMECMISLPALDIHLAGRTINAPRDFMTIDEALLYPGARCLTTGSGYEDVRLILEETGGMYKSWVVLL